MIRQPHPFLSASSIVALAALVAAGCAETKQAPRPAAKAEAAAKAKAEAVVGSALTSAAEPAATASAPAAATTTSGEVAAATTVAEFVKQLGSAAAADDRLAVIDQIGAIGQNGRPALDALVSAFADTDARVRWHAARAVGLIGEDARSAIPPLVKLLEDADPIVVTQAAAALGSIREDDGREQLPAADAAVYATVIDPLAKTAVHADGRARRAAVRALRRYKSLADLGPIVSKQLADADPGVIVAALHTLADMGDEAVPFLMEALKDPKSRYWAEVALAEIGPDAAPAAPALAAAAEEGPTEERLQALLALAAIGDRAAAAAPVAIKALESDDAALRLPAAFALGRMKASAGDESLKKVAAGDDPFLGGVAAWALARIHPDDRALVADAVARLRQGLANPDPDARAACINGLSDLSDTLGDDVRAELAGEFAGLLADADPAAGRSAGAALIRLGSPAVAALRAKLADPALRPNVLEILAAMGPAAKPALGDLVAALGDADPNSRGDAAVAIASLGADGAEAVPQLEKMLANASAVEGERYAAAYALGRIGPAAAAATPVLRELAQSQDEMLAAVATWAALKTKPDDASQVEAAIPLLRRALRGDRELVRLEAAVALGDIGPAAVSAIPILELVAEDDPVKEVRAAAAAALAKIRTPR
jgi:HEAT repeat protein